MKELLNCRAEQPVGQKAEGDEIKARREASTLMLITLSLLNSRKCTGSISRTAVGRRHTNQVYTALVSTKPGVHEDVRKMGQPRTMAEL